MQQNKNILIGTNTLFHDWLDSIKKINEKNIIIFDFGDNEKLQTVITENKIDYFLPLSEKDYFIITPFLI